VVVPSKHLQPILTFAGRAKTIKVLHHDSLNEVSNFLARTLLIVTQNFKLEQKEVLYNLAPILDSHSSFVS
jgi:hypothetical protein